MPAPPPLLVVALLPGFNSLRPRQAILSMIRLGCWKASLIPQKSAPRTRREDQERRGGLWSETRTWNSKGVRSSLFGRAVKRIRPGRWRGGRGRSGVAPRPALPDEDSFPLYTSPTARYVAAILQAAASAAGSLVSSRSSSARRLLTTVARRIRRDTFLKPNLGALTSSADSPSGFHGLRVLSYVAPV